MGLITRALAAALLVPALAAAQEVMVPNIPAYSPKTYISRKEYLLLLKGKAFMDKKNFPKAIEMFSRASVVNPKSIAVYWEGASHESSALQRIALWKESSKEDDKTLRFDASEISKHLKRAQQDYQKSLQFFPDTALVCYRIGKLVLIHQQDFVSAERHLLEATRLAPNEASYRTALARIYLLLKRYPEARKECETALTENNFAVQSEAHLVLGWIELEQRNFLRATEELKLSLSLDPSQGLCHYYLAKSYEGAGDTASAIESYESFQRTFVPSTLQEIDILQETDKILQLYRRRKK